VLASADRSGWLSGEHFSVDGPLIQAWAGHKSFVPKDGKDDESDGGNGNFKEKEPATIRMHPATIPMRACTGRATMPAACVTWDMRSLTIATGWLPTRGSPSPMGMLNSRVTVQLYKAIQEVIRAPYMRLGVVTRKNGETYRPWLLEKRGQSQIARRWNMARSSAVTMRPGLNGLIMNPTAPSRSAFLTVSAS
jgi:hypothetical protein